MPLFGATHFKSTFSWGIEPSITRDGQPESEEMVISGIIDKETEGWIKSK